MTSEHSPATPAHSLQSEPRTTGLCRHTPPCPSAEATDRDAAAVVSAHPEQGWSLLCNGVVVFEDFGEILPDGQSCAARRHDLIMASPHRRAS